MQSESNEQLHLAARLYYVDGWDQAQVAELVRVSQAKVSRLLSLARKRGIVRITVADYDARQRGLENDLVRLLGLRTVIVVKAMDELPLAKLRVLTAHFAAPLLESLIPPGSILALGGGVALQSLIHQLPITSNAPSVVQAMGRAAEHLSLSDAEELGRSIAEKWDGKFFLLNAPLYLPNKTSCDALLKLDQIKAVFEKLRQAAVAIFEIRSFENSPLADSLAANQLDQLRESHAIGEICGRYFDHGGEECRTPLKTQSVSVEFDCLRKIPLTVGVAVGKDDAPAVLAAIRGGLVKSFIADESTAKAVLELANNEISEKKASLHYHLS